MTTENKVTDDLATGAERSLRGIAFLTTLIKAGQEKGETFVPSKYIKEHIPKTEKEAFQLKADLESLAFTIELVGMLYALIGRQKFVPAKTKQAVFSDVNEVPLS